MAISIEKNLEYVNGKIKSINKDASLIAVTKTIDNEKVNEAIALGVTDIGENRVQEIEKKYDEIKGDVNWHMIGHLQSNKVKYIIDKVKLIHSLDRKSLAKEIQKRAKQNDMVAEVLVQVNVSEEETKFGLKVEEVMPFMENMKNYPNIKVKGLMTMAPHEEDIEKTRPVFKKLRGLSEEIESKNFENVEMKHLSMGMTNDYEIALEEGATLVRVGTGIFGERVYD